MGAMSETKSNAARVREINDSIRYTMWSVFRVEPGRLQRANVLFCVLSCQNFPSQESIETNISSIIAPQAQLFETAKDRRVSTETLFNKEGTFSRSIKLPGAIVTPVILGLPKVSDGDFSEL